MLSSVGDLTSWANEIMAYATDAAVNRGKKSGPDLRSL
ncbi:hypothetical protein ACM26V_22085 [Salipaludibacillus sp. HK11]